MHGFGSMVDYGSYYICPPRDNRPGCFVWTDSGIVVLFRHVVPPPYYSQVNETSMGLVHGFSFDVLWKGPFFFVFFSFGR